MKPTTVALGTPAPKFELPATDGQTYSSDDFSAPVLVVMFLCNHCPYVIATQQRLIDLTLEFEGRADFVGICSNDPVRYPDDDFEHMVQHAEKHGFPFKYLHDASQDVARGYQALCTPDIFVYNSERELAYRGRIDDNWKNESAVTQHDLRDAILALLSGESPAETQHPSMGCSIKWKY